MNTIKTYSDLSKFINFFKTDLFMRNKKENIEQIKLDDLICIIAIFSIKKFDFELINDYSYNRYFIDSLNLKKIPNSDELNSFISSHENYLILNKLFPELNSSLAFIPFLKKLTSLYLNKYYLKNTYNYSASKSWTKKKLNFFNKNGYVIIPNVLTSEECDYIRNLLYKIAKCEKRNNAGYFYGDNRFQRIYNLVNKAKTFQKLLLMPIVKLIMDEIFDRPTLHQKYILSSWHANIIPPYGESQKLHVDAALPEPLPEWIVRANINFILEDYTKNNGATEVVPGSHMLRRIPNKSDIDKYKNMLTKLTAKKGSLIVWTGHLWHRSGTNSTDKSRIALLACFAASHLLEMALEENHPVIVDKSRSKDFPEDLKRLLSISHGQKQGAKFKYKFYNS